MDMIIQNRDGGVQVIHDIPEAKVQGVFDECTSRGIWVILVGRVIVDTTGDNVESMPYGNWNQSSADR